MTWLSNLFFGSGGGVVSSTASGVQVPYSLWPVESNVTTLVYSDHFASVDAVDRNAAMTVPPVKRGRAIITGSCADLPLELGKLDGSGWTAAKRQPNWFSNTGTFQTPWHRMALTLDDLIFNGWSLWGVRRGAKTEGAAHAPILDAVRIAPQRWTFDANSPTGVSVNGAHVQDPDSVILFQGPDEGVLTTSADTIRAWRALSRTRVSKARNPIPMTVLQETTPNTVTQAEAEAFVEAWGNKRAQENGMVGFLPAKVTMQTHGDTKPEMFDTAFNALRLDVANALNLPASLLDGSTATASLTYVTTEGQRTSLIDWLEYWLAPIEARLSMPDVTPLGSVVRFDRSNLINVPNDRHGAASDETQPVETPASPAPQE
ncbi:hypothetical protein LXM50_01640 [Microbacterium sp. Au-Mic1]|uniref:hypothetical protein n=1 Tax=Microbacterium sp. Au-Mic1 TaxID=2906457 RepID=UPI001E6273F8|nr:hypothetical protein [Microbacterium sp. Au-Mic1]MCE4024669.1 hypothetical protein [Microbacterium sp. Au-Mic1]